MDYDGGNFDPAIHVPGYAEALAKETEKRDLAFVRVHPDIMGIPVCHMTPEHLAILRGIDSPFVAYTDEFCRQQASAVDAFLFVWIVSVDFVPGNGWKSKWRKRRLGKRMRSMNWGELCKSISAYVDNTFWDSSGGGGQKQKPIASDQAMIIDVVAREYHWSQSEIMSTPFVRLFQYFRLISARRQMEAGKRPAFWNRSDKLVGDWLDERNKTRAN